MTVKCILLTYRFWTCAHRPCSKSWAWAREIPVSHSRAVQTAAACCLVSRSMSHYDAFSSSKWQRIERKDARRQL